MSKVLKHFYIREDQNDKLERWSSPIKSQAEIVREALDRYFESFNPNKGGENE